MDWKIEIKYILISKNVEEYFLYKNCRKAIKWLENCSLYLLITNSIYVRNMYDVYKIIKI